MAALLNASVFIATSAARASRIHALASAALVSAIQRELIILQMVLALLLAVLAAAAVAELNTTAHITIRDSLAVTDPTIAPVSLLVEEDEVMDILVNVRCLL